MNTIKESRISRVNVKLNKELEDVLFISKHIAEIKKELDTITPEQIISHYDYGKIEKLNKKVERLRNAKKLHENYLYNLNDLVKESDEIVRRI